MALSQSDTLRLLPVIRIALTGVVAMMGIIAWYLQDSGVIQPVFSPNEPMLLGYFVLVLVLMVGVMLYFKRKRREARTASRFVSYTIVAWTAAEGVSMVGAIFYMMTGNLTYYISGYLLLFMAFFLVPAQQGAANR